MKNEKSFFTTLFYTVTLTAVMMIPLALVLWLLGQYIVHQSNHSEWLTIYLNKAAISLVFCGILLIVGAIAYTKNQSWAKVPLAFGCILIIVLSCFPLYDVIVAQQSWGFRSLVIAAWMLFALPYAAFLYRLR